MQTPSPGIAGANSILQAKQTLISGGAGRVPLHIQIRKRLYQRILEGKYKAGDKLLTDRAIMDEFKVGRMTARAAIRNLVEANVVTRRPGCGTFLTDPKEWTQPGQKGGKQLKVLVVYQDMTKMHAGSDDSHRLAAIHEALKQNGMEASLLSLPANHGLAYQMLSQYLKTHDIDGVIMFCIDDEELYELVEHIPAVASDIVLFSHVVAVYTDFREVIKTSVEHLSHLGHKAIGLVTEMRHCVQFATCWTDAFERKLGELGHPFRRELVSIPRTPAELESAVKEMLKRDDRPTAVVAVGPDAVELIYRFAGSHGLKIPADLSVFGYGQACEYIPFEPPLTYMTYKLEDLGACYVGALFQQLAGRIPDRQARQLPVHSVTGESTAAPHKT